MLNAVHSRKAANSQMQSDHRSPPATSLLAGSATGILVHMSEVTRVLAAVERGDPQAAERLLPLVYDELRRLAAQRLAGEKPGQTLQATALVHEAYVRLVGDGTGPPWNGR